MSSVELDDKFNERCEIPLYLAEDIYELADERRARKSYPTKSCLNPPQLAKYLEGKRNEPVEKHLKDCTECNKRRLVFVIAELTRDLNFSDIDGLVDELTWQVITGDLNPYSKKAIPKSTRETLETSGNLDKLVKELYPNCRSYSQVKNYLIGQEDPEFEKHSKGCNSCLSKKEYAEKEIKSN